MNNNRNQYSQFSMIREFNDKYREDFNEEIFSRNDDDIIREIEKVILSCQRSRSFTIKVLNFNVVDDYDKINEIMKEYENNNLNRKKTTNNRYDNIQLKESFIRLLMVDYYIEVYNTNVHYKRSKVLRVYIQIPRIVDKYYFYINGNYYLSMYQIVESTYNNSSTNSNIGMVAYKPMFMATRTFRFQINSSKDKASKMMCNHDGEVMKGVYYSSLIFNKSINIMKYLFARFGLYKSMDLLECKYIRFLPNENSYIKDPTNNYYIQKHNIMIEVPKYIYDNDTVIQSFVYTVFIDIDSETNINNIYSEEYWLIRLGKSFGSKSVEKGYSILESLETICDISSMEHLKLPLNNKKDIYDIIIWIVRQFSELRIKDNLNINHKRIRWAEYFACIYAYKLIKGIYRISDKGNKISLQSIEKSINISPDYLIKAITKDKLTNTVSMVNDLDSIAAIKYSYKGISGLGEDNTSIPLGYKRVHPSHVGKVDLDSSSNSDPGMTGMLCPISSISDGSFSEETEPLDWRDKIDDLYDEYRRLHGIKQTLLFKKDLDMLNSLDESRLRFINETLDSSKELLNPFSSLDKELYQNQLFSIIKWDDKYLSKVDNIILEEKEKEENDE